MAARAMVHYHRAKGKSAQMPGETEIHDVRNALRTHGIPDPVEIFLCFGDAGGRRSARACGPKHHECFVLATAGMAEDGWTIFVNGIVDSGKEIFLDKLGFLHCQTEDKVSWTQRRGRGDGWPRHYIAA